MSEKKTFKETKIGAFLASKAPKILVAIGVPDGEKCIGENNVCQDLFRFDVKDDVMNCKRFNLAPIYDYKKCPQCLSSDIEELKKEVEKTLRNPILNLKMMIQYDDITNQISKILLGGKDEK